MLTKQDLQQIESLGISEAMVEHQMEQHRKGFPYLKLQAAASIGNGIMAPTATERDAFLAEWERYQAEGRKVVKFVPASGAASRMFKDLFAFLNAPYNEPTNAFEKEFFDNTKLFAFRKQLCKSCKADTQSSVCDLKEAGRYKEIVAHLLGEEGLNYGNLPKG
ncbi:MAG: DUF4301 family protein, partial [Prevotella conceptionensis]